MFSVNLNLRGKKKVSSAAIVFFKINSSNHFPEDGCVSKSRFIQLDALQACPLIAAQQRRLLAEEGASLGLAPLGGQGHFLRQCSVVAISPSLSLFSPHIFSEIQTRATWGKSFLKHATTAIMGFC